jgi:uncharacterized glyoxalase superfamily protein PhnB
VEHIMPDAPCIYPTFRCRDAAAMIDWLGRAFGFTVHARHGEADRVDHAELAIGSSMVMLGSARDDAFGALVGDPAPGGSALYVAVADVDALFARAAAAGATIVEPPTDRDYGSRELTCRDPEGRIWCFGTYWPKAADPVQP